MKTRCPLVPGINLGLVLFLTAFLGGRESSAALPRGDGESGIFARSLVSLGDTTRVQRALAKARAGEPVTVAVIGGSITQGAAASSFEKQYGSLVAQWWREHFPRSKISYINAGIGATGSNYGALRAQRDLLAHHPDFVVIEYAVNDPNDRAFAETLEGLVRQVLAQPNQPAAMLLFMMNREGKNAQEWHAKVGAHYGLPMVSFRDALWPEIQADRIKWEDVEADMVHPNDRGHAYCARFVTAVLDQVLRDLPPADRLPQPGALPSPLLDDLFEHVTLREADALVPVENSGWALDPKTKAWTSTQPGSAIRFELEGQVFLTMHYVIKGPMGRARVTVDGQKPKELEGWFDQTWGGYRQTNEIARLAPGRHVVRFELLPESAPGSTGHEFRILGLGAAGTVAP